MKVFLDTNIIIDFCGQRVPFFDAAIEIFDMQREVKLISSSHLYRL